MTQRIVQVYNRYLHPGGEEKSVDRIYSHLADRHQIARCIFKSKDWTGSAAPSRLGQLRRMFYNAASRRLFESVVRQSQAQVGLFHNLYPVASPALYKAAWDSGLPVVQYLHNFRPFSVSGTLYANGLMMEEALSGDYRREIWTGSWQGSRLKSALFAILLKKLHHSGWLGCVKRWVAISEFMKGKIVAAGVPEQKIVALRHSWDAMREPPLRRDDGSYLFLGRLVEAKGLSVLIRAWHQLRAELKESAPALVIAGEGPERDQVLTAADENPSIRYAGMVDGTQKHELLRSCRALVVPSTWWEPLGLVVYEAYDFGKPVLAAKSGGLTETVNQGVTGFLHPAGDVEALVADVRRLEGLGEASRLGLGDAGRAWLLTEASPLLWKQKMDGILSAAVEAAQDD